MSEGQQKKTLGIAIASLVFGCLFIVPFLGIMFSIPAIILGVIALVKIGNNKETLKGRGMAIWGIVLGGLGLMIIPVAILAAIAIPNLLRARLSANEIGAQASLRTISTAMESYRYSNGNGNYTGVTLAGLSAATPPYIDAVLGAGAKQGYTIALTVVDANSYVSTAVPQTASVSGVRSFCITEDGVLRVQVVGGVIADRVACLALAATQ
ncbi:MAG: DUF4190 domain-containing protein [Candidatus Omnitrophota bacterium]